MVVDLSKIQRDFISSYLLDLDIVNAAARTGFKLLDCIDNKVRRFYVYALIDPANNEIFYIGKGKGLRWKHHARPTRGIDNSRKAERIAKIKKAHGAYRSVYLATDLDSPTALLIERAFIRAIGIRRLTNLTRGDIDIKIRAYLDIVRLLVKMKPAYMILEQNGAEGMPLYIYLLNTFINHFNHTHKDLRGFELSKDTLRGVKQLVYKDKFRTFARPLLTRFDMMP